MLPVSLSCFAFNVDIQLTSSTCWWMMQSFGMTIRLQSVQISPGGSIFPTQGFSQPPFLIYSSLPSPSFIPSEISCSCLDFTVRKPNTRTWGGGAWRKEWMRRGPQAIWQLGVKVSLSPPRSRTLSLFFSRCCAYPLWRESWTSVCTVVCQKSLYCAKNSTVCSSVITSYFLNSPQTISHSEEYSCDVAPMYLHSSVKCVWAGELSLYLNTPAFTIMFQIQMMSSRSVQTLMKCNKKVQ